MKKILVIDRQGPLRGLIGLVMHGVYEVDGFSDEDRIASPEIDPPDLFVVDHDVRVHMILNSIILLKPINAIWMSRLSYCQAARNRMSRSLRLAQKRISVNHFP